MYPPCHFQPTSSPCLKASQAASTYSYLLENTYGALSVERAGYNMLTDTLSGHRLNMFENVCEQSSGCHHRCHPTVPANLPIKPNRVQIKPTTFMNQFDHIELRIQNTFESMKQAFHVFTGHMLPACALCTKYRRWISATVSSTGV